jgi:hypothetical protein
MDFVRRNADPRYSFNGVLAIQKKGNRGLFHARCGVRYLSLFKSPSGSELHHKPSDQGAVS